MPRRKVIPPPKETPNKRRKKSGPRGASESSTGSSTGSPTGCGTGCGTGNVNDIDYDKLANAILKQSGQVPGVPTMAEEILELDEENHLGAIANSSGETNSTPVTQSITDFVQNILTSGEPATPKSAPICLTDGIPLAAPISHRLKAKIWGDQFIDLRLLLQRQEEPISLSIATGSITVQHNATKNKMPLSIQQWTDAFLIFMAVYLERHQNQASHLLKYCFFIRELQKTLGDKAWITYDESFRQLKEANPHLPWQKPVEELRVKAATYTNLQTHLQPFRKNTGKMPVKFCFAFNNGGPCIRNPCPYSHTCQHCFGQHPKAKCRVNKKKPFSSNNFKPHSTANPNQTRTTT